MFSAQWMSGSLAFMCCVYFSPHLRTGMTVDIDQSTGSHPLSRDAIRSGMKVFTRTFFKGLIITRWISLFLPPSTGTNVSGYSKHCFSVAISNVKVQYLSVCLRAPLSPLYTVGKKFQQKFVCILAASRRNSLVAFHSIHVRS